MKRCVIAAVLVCLLVSFAVPVVLATEASNQDVPTMEFRFGDYGSNGDYLADVTQALLNSYIARTVNWRFEAASDTYQFRIAGKHPGVTTTGKNLFSPGALQLLGAKGCWYALRLRASETGKFALSLNKAREATIQIYFFPAYLVEDALGANAISYAQTICKEPYYAGDTEAFAAYKEVIGGLLANATPVMTEIAETPTEMTGEYSFQADNEYIMVIEFLNEEGYRTQLAPLVATWTGEAEILPEANVTQKEPLNPGVFVPVVIVVVAVGGVVIGAVTSRKKSPKTEK